MLGLQHTDWEGDSSVHDRALPVMQEFITEERRHKEENVDTDKFLGGGKKLIF